MLKAVFSRLSLEQAMRNFVKKEVEISHRKHSGNTIAVKKGFRHAYPAYFTLGMLLFPMQIYTAHHFVHSPGILRKDPHQQTMCISGVETEEEAINFRFPFIPRAYEPYADSEGQGGVADWEVPYEYEEEIAHESFKGEPRRHIGYAEH